MQSYVRWVYKTETRCNRGQFIKRDFGYNSVLASGQTRGRTNRFGTAATRCSVERKINQQLQSHSSICMIKPSLLYSLRHSPWRYVNCFYAVSSNILRFLRGPLRLTGVSIVFLAILCFTFQIGQPVV